MKSSLALILLACGLQAAAQSPLFDSVNRKRYKIAKTGFAVLGGWGALNVGAGLLGQGHTSGEQRQFYRAVTFGGLVDLAFAGIGYFGAQRMSRQPHTTEETFSRQAVAEKLFLFSVGLDIGAIAFGLYTKERANRFSGEKRDWLTGAGKTLMLQGASLIVFDGVMYLLQVRNGAGLRQKLQSLGFLSGKNRPALASRF